MSEYLDHITDVEDVKNGVNNLALKMYQRGMNDMLNLICDYSIIWNDSNSKKVPYAFIRKIETDFVQKELE